MQFVRPKQAGKAVQTSDEADCFRRKCGACYVTTGGGSYTLPIENAEKIKIRNYLEYDENGIVVISDFRIMGFSQKGSEDNA